MTCRNTITTEFGQAHRHTRTQNDFVLFFVTTLEMFLFIVSKYTTIFVCKFCSFFFLSCFRFWWDGGGKRFCNYNSNTSNNV